MLIAKLFRCAHKLFKQSTQWTKNEGYNLIGKTRLMHKKQKNIHTIEFTCRTVVWPYSYYGHPESQRKTPLKTNTFINYGYLVYTYKHISIKLDVRNKTKLQRGIQLYLFVVLQKLILSLLHSHFVIFALILILVLVFLFSNFYFDIIC